MIRALLYEQFRPERARLFRELVDLHAHPERLEAVQRARLQALCQHAKSKCSHYREHLSGLSDDLSNWKSVPILTRQDLFREWEGLKSSDHQARHSFENRSGGSTGEPVRFLQDRATHEWKQAVSRLFDHWAGHTQGASRVLLWGSERDLHGGETMRGQFAKFARNEEVLQAFRMTPQDMYGYVDTLNRTKPDLLVGYADALYEFSRFVEAAGVEVRPPGRVISSAGTLFPHMREKIERVMGCELFDRYGSREVGGIASEKEAGRGLHISGSTHFVEIVDEKGDLIEEVGVVGRVIVTYLTNFSMPLIRYDIGDLASWEIIGKVLSNVEGRRVDALRDREGVLVSPLYLVHVLGVTLEEPGIARFQIAQMSPTAFEVRFELRGDSELNLERWKAEVRQKFELVFGEGLEVQFRRVGDWPASGSGKFQYVCGMPLW